MNVPADLNPFSQAFAQALFARYPTFTSKRYPTTSSDNSEFYLNILELHCLRKRLALDTEGNLIGESRTRVHISEFGATSTYYNHASEN